VKLRACSRCLLTSWLSQRGYLRDHLTLLPCLPAETVLFFHLTSVHIHCTHYIQHIQAIFCTWNNIWGAVCLYFCLVTHFQESCFLFMQSFKDDDWSWCNCITEAHLNSASCCCILLINNTERSSCSSLFSLSAMQCCDEAQDSGHQNCKKLVSHTH